mgnify:CR=1 FL=1
MSKEGGYVIFSPRQTDRPTLVMPVLPKTVVGDPVVTEEAIAEPDITGLTDPVVVKLLASLRSESNVAVTKKSVALLLKLIMECVENEGLNGERAKETVLEIAEVIIKEKAPASEREWLLDAVRDDAMSGLIDLVVSASKNELDLNQSKKVGRQCVPCLFSAVTKRLSRKSRTKTSSPRSTRAGR